jgi:hypothetical protein
MSGPFVETVPFRPGVLPCVVIVPGSRLLTTTVHLPSTQVVQVGNCLVPVQQQQQQQHQVNRLAYTLSAACTAMALLLHGCSLYGSCCVWML